MPSFASQKFFAQTSDNRSGRAFRVFYALNSLPIALVLGLVAVYFVASDNIRPIQIEQPTLGQRGGTI
jgi:hypothetical protein